MKLHDFTKTGWGNRLENSGACWSKNGSVASGDFIQCDNNTWYKVIEAKECGDPKDMSFIKSYKCIGDLEYGEKASVELLQNKYEEHCGDKSLYLFPLKDNKCNTQ